MRPPAPSGKTAGIILNSDFSFCTSPAPQFPHHRQFCFSGGRHFFPFFSEKGVDNFKFFVIIKT